MKLVVEKSSMYKIILTFPYKVKFVWYKFIDYYKVSYDFTNHTSYLVDPASSHMLVSKTKPCMSKYK